MRGGVSRGEGQGLGKALWLQGEEERERLRVWVEDGFLRLKGGVNEAKTQA